MPYDRLYNKVGYLEDNYFNVENMCADLETNETNTICLTACLFDGYSLVDGTASH